MGSALASEPPQRERLVRLHTPLHADALLAQRLDLQEHIGATDRTAGGFRAEVTALAEDIHIELKMLTLQPASLPVRPARVDQRGLPDVRLHPRLNVIGAGQEQTNKQLPVEHGLWASGDALQGRDTRGGGDGADGADNAIGGGAGTVAAWTRPDLIVAAPSGIASVTPADAIYTAGATVSLSAEDIQHTVQGRHATVAKDGLVIYTYGKASDARKPNTETGIALHSASGSVNTQSQQGQTRLTADKAITVASTQGMVRITAPEHVLLTAGGAALELAGGNITLKGPGNVEFRASMKELKGGIGACAHFQLTRSGTLSPSDFNDSFVVTNDAGTPMAGRRYAITREDGSVLRGTTDVAGRIAQQVSFKGERIAIKLLGKS